MHGNTTTLIYKTTINNQTSIKNVCWFWFLEPEKEKQWIGVEWLVLRAIFIVEIIPFFIWYQNKKWEKKHQIYIMLLYIHLNWIAHWPLLRITLCLFTSLLVYICFVCLIILKLTRWLHFSGITFVSIFFWDNTFVILNAAT